MPSGSGVEDAHGRRGLDESQQGHSASWLRGIETQQLSKLWPVVFLPNFHLLKPLGKNIFPVVIGSL